MKKIRGFLRVLLFIWQLPQHLLGLLPIHLLGAKKQCVQREHGGMDEIWFWEYEPFNRFSRFISGVSLGRYIILPAGATSRITILHEHGHSIQSQRLGWLYLPVIGTASAVFSNLWDRLFHKSWPVEKRYKWYYSRFPEKQADRLGGVSNRNWGNNALA